MTGKVVGITGAAGYLGERLIAHLSTQPDIERIVALDKKPLPSQSGVISHVVDVSEATTLRAILVEHGVTHLIHAAFQITPQNGDEYAMRAANVVGSMNVFRAALNVVEHLSFISSVAVYGYRAGHPPRIPEATPLHPTMTYGKHKLEAEAALRIFSRLPYREGLKTRLAILRFAAICGPQGAARSHLRALTAQPFFVLSEGGRARTQAIHEDDAAAFIGAVVAADAEGTYNAAPDDFATWADIGQLCNRPILSLPRPVLNGFTRLNGILPALNGFTRDVVDLFSETLVVDTSAAKTRLEWQPRFSTCDAFYQMFKALGTAR
jgi:nucleoside-diphosphate-sugar epimerase